MGATCPQDGDGAPGQASLASLLPSSPAQEEGCILETPGARHPWRSRPRLASFPQGPHPIATGVGRLSKGSVGSSPILLDRHQWCKVWRGAFVGLAGYLRLPAPGEDFPWLVPSGDWGPGQSLSP